MDQGPLVTEQIDAGAKFLAEFQKYVPVSAAFWIKDVDDGSWSLYVASEQITDDNFDVGYAEVLRIAGQIQDPWFDPFQVKLVGADDPLAKAALGLFQRYRGSSPTRLNVHTFGGTEVGGVVVYPPSLPVGT